MFSYSVNFERKVKGASALYCVYIYILKNKVLYVFITFNCYKKPAIFNMWFGGFLFCLFFLFGVLFVFAGKRKKKTLAFSVCTAAGQEIKILKFLKIKEEEKKVKELTTGAYAITSFLI